MRDCILLLFGDCEMVKLVRRKEYALGFICHKENFYKFVSIENSDDLFVTHLF
ncbi:hypothetical protein SAMN05216383_1363 [Prevotella sp. KH2C16]|nr:hypothetical protein SAMN05216383_1363 [Prevotella sp. KH2C16]